MNFCTELFLQDHLYGEFIFKPELNVPSTLPLAKFVIRRLHYGHFKIKDSSIRKTAYTFPPK